MFETMSTETFINWKKEFEENEEYRASLTDLLNKLEYLCMYIKNNLANDAVIYQSLHGIFLSTVKISYFLIAWCNTTKYNKVYTNIIHVYRRWNKKVSRAKVMEEFFKNIKS